MSTELRNARRRIACKIGPKRLERTKTALKPVLKKALFPSAPSLKLSDLGHLAPDYPDQGLGEALLLEALGATSPDFLVGFIKRLTETASWETHINVDRANFLLSYVIDNKPKDPAEAMHLLSMAEVQLLLGWEVRQSIRAGEPFSKERAQRSVNAFARTAAAQMEGLKRYRTGGEQKITVQYVTVKEGGQAIVQQNQGATPELENQAPGSPALADPTTASPPKLEDKTGTAISDSANTSSPSKGEGVKRPRAARPHSSPPRNG